MKPPLKQQLNSSQNLLARSSLYVHSEQSVIRTKSYQMYRNSRMNKESVLIEFRRILNPMSIIFSKWQVDKAVQVPVREGLVPIPLQPAGAPKRPGNRTAQVGKRLAALVALVLGLSTAMSAHAAQSVSIAWNPSSDPSTVGYVVYARLPPLELYRPNECSGTNTMVNS